MDTLISMMQGPIVKFLLLSEVRYGNGFLCFLNSRVVDLKRLS